jgi:hypothetical protein
MISGRTTDTYGISNRGVEKISSSLVHPAGDVKNFERSVVICAFVTHEGPNSREHCMHQIYVTHEQRVATAAL